MFIKDLFEAPISGIHTYGDMTEPGSFRAADLSMIATPKAHEKITRVLQKAPVDIELHFLNMPEKIRNIDRHLSAREPKDIDAKLINVGFMTPQRFEARYHERLRANPNALNAVYVENEGNSRVRMTPWIIAHRLSHAIGIGNGAGTEFSRQYVKYFYDPIHDIGKYYDPKIYWDEELVELAHAFGTTAAARNGTFTNWGEWYHDCFAQFCITGDIRFKKAEETFENKHNFTYRLPHPQGSIPAIDSAFEEMRANLKTMFTDMLTERIGQIVVL